MTDDMLYTRIGAAERARSRSMMHSSVYGTAAKNWTSGSVISTGRRPALPLGLSILEEPEMRLMSKPIKTDPKLLRLLEESAKRVAAMSPDELEAMMKAQAKSWARQDLD
jgi:hypothetical protein